MALLLTDAQVLSARVRNGKPYRIAELELDLLIVKMSAAASIEVGKLRTKIQAGNADVGELVLALLQASCSDPKGRLLDKAAAEQILGVMSLDAMNELVTALSPDPAAAKAASETPEGNPSGSQASA